MKFALASTSEATQSLSWLYPQAAQCVDVALERWSLQMLLSWHNNVLLDQSEISSPGLLMIADEGLIGQQWK